MALTFTYAILSNGIYSGLLGTLSTITINACTRVKSIFNHKNPDINNFLNKLDIEVSLEIIESVLHKKYSQHYNNTSSISDFVVIGNTEYNDPEIVCLQNLSNVITNIHDILQKIDNKVEKHKRKWFVGWRYLNVTKDLNLLEQNTLLLNKRFDMLRKINKFMN